jgi:DNA-binding IclR family transcriptional regulator
MVNKKTLTDLELVENLIKHSKLGISITNIVDESKLSRSSVRTCLAKLEGANKVEIRQVGMAKLYSIK